MEKSTRIVGIVGAVLLVAGAVGWGIQLSGGLLAHSGMTNIFLWGVMIAMFAFLVGFGAGSQLVASAIWLTGREDLRPLARTAATWGLACVAGAGVAILADLGALRNILAMIVGLNLRSPLAWDMIAMTAFIVLAVIELVAMARQSPRTQLWAVLAGVAAVALQVVEGLLFSTQSAHSWWATPIMPVDFLAVAFVSGSALMLLIACVSGRLRKEGAAEAPRADHAAPAEEGAGAAGAVSWLARFCAWAIAAHLVLALADLALVVAEGTPQAGGVLDVLGAYAPLYASELVRPAGAMAILFSVGRKGSRPWCATAAVLTMAGILAHRMMLLYPAYNAPSLYLQLSGTPYTTGPYPISTGRYLDWDATFGLATAYAPAPAELLATLLPVGVALLAAAVLTWMVRRAACPGAHANCDL